MISIKVCMECEHRVGEAVPASAKISHKYRDGRTVWINDWRKCKLCDTMLVGDGLREPPYDCPHMLEHMMSETVHVK